MPIFFLPSEGFIPNRAEYMFRFTVSLQVRKDAVCLLRIADCNPSQRVFIPAFLDCAIDQKIRA